MSYEYKVYNDNILNSADSLDGAVKFANECIQEYRDDAQDGWPEEVENVRIVMETHQPVQVNLRPVDRCERQYTDCEHSCDYELQPTAEWQSIQSQLSEHEWMKAFLAQLQITPDLEGEPTEEARNYFDNWNDLVNEREAERDELSAELERVKAEHTNFKQGNAKLLEIAEEERDKANNQLVKAKAELTSLKSRLPVNADGDVVLWGDTQFTMQPDHTDKLIEDEVEIVRIDKDDNGVIFAIVSSKYDAKEYDVMFDDLFSTSESCRAAGGAE